jgi:hypothetical protein
VCVQALELLGIPGAADPELDRSSAVAARSAPGKLGANAALLLRGADEAGCQVGLVLRPLRTSASTPPAASSLEIAATRWRQVT